jgi:hypothetical protein
LLTGTDVVAKKNSLKILSKMSQAWWCMPVVSALWRLRQEDCEFKTLFEK